MYKLLLASLFGVLNISSSNSQYNELPHCEQNLTGIILVSTLDGKLSTLNSSGSLLWQLDTGPGPLLMSNIHKLELTNNGEWIRIIPSLSGTLYKFDGSTVDPISMKIENLLKSSFRYSDDTVIAGGIEKRTYGVNVKSGKIIYECTPNKCSQDRSNNDELLIVERNTQTIRAVEPRSGVERWNFSVGLNNVKFLRENCLESDPNNDWQISAILPDGFLYATPIKSKTNLTAWHYKFSAPIVQVWRWNGRELVEINLFAPKTVQQFKSSDSMAAIYIGMHEKQLYIQESVFMQNMLDGAPGTDVAVAEGKSLTKIPWNPIPASNEEHNRTEDDSTALSLLYSTDYANGNGYYLYAEVKEETRCKQNSSLNSTTLQSIVMQYFVDFKLINWWKEILFIAVNLICLQIWHLRIGRQRARKLSQEELDKQQIAQFSSRYLQDFDTIQCLGKGGFGIVFQVKQKIDECDYAIKRITLPTGEISRERVMREVKALAKLEHPNIVRYFCSWVETPPLGWEKEHDAPWIKDCNFSVTATSTNYVTSTEPSFSKRNKSASVSIDISFRENDQTRQPDEDDVSDFIVFEEDSKTESKSVNFSKDISERSNSLATLTQNSLVECSNSTIDSLDHWQKKINWRRPDRKHHSWDIIQNKDIVLDEPPVYLYIQMQLCQKESLKEWLSNHLDRDIHECLDIFLQILEAVEYVHLRGLIHRDLKPSNIFFSLDGKIKVGDFGLVKDVVEDVLGDSNTSNSYSSYGYTREVGTQLYMSPEQCNSRSYDFKVDIYSLGLIFFELLVPFTTDSERVTVLTNIKKDKYPENFQKDFPDLYDLIKSMLSEDPTKRLTTIGIKARPPYNLVDKKYNEDYHFRLPNLKNNIAH